MALKIKKRCIRCLSVLDKDGKCTNPNCVKYAPPVEQTDKTEQQTGEG